MCNLVNALFGLGALCAPLLAEACDRLAGSTLKAYPVTAALTAASALTFLLLPSPPTPKALAAAAAAAAADGGGGASAAVPLLGESSGGEDGGGSGQRKAAPGGQGGNPWAMGGPLTHILLPVRRGRASPRTGRLQAGCPPGKRPAAGARGCLRGLSRATAAWQQSSLRARPSGGAAGLNGPA
jgi:hypothetical protein